MKISSVVLGIILLASVGVGCASSTAGDPYDAGDQVNDAGPGGTDAFVGEGFGEPCDLHTDCDDGLCYRPNPSDAMGTCTVECTGNCPEGYACKLVQIAEGTDVRMCVPAETTFCESCTTNADCGDSSDFCISLTAGNFCTVDCSQDATICPAGFTCRSVSGASDTVVGMQCLPINGICCVDGDGDMRGEGSGCVTTDCDDDNPAVYDDAAEICDGFDQDCVGGVDVDVTDCAAAECKLGMFGYFARATEPCESGSCTDQNAVLCDLYTCADGGENGDTCATACDLEDDGKCIPTAHCDASVCYDDLANGLASDENSDCKSNHSQNGFCCDFSDCCQMASDCPTFGTVAPVCDSAPTCQGTRGEAVCTTNFQCASTGTVEDDSACGVTDLAQDCGFYKDMYCNGTVAQLAPVCPTTCSADTDCDDNAYCNSANQCVPDEGNGGVCDNTDGQGNNECVNDYCNNGFCCDGPSGDCCSSETDCPASYSGPPTCTVQSACQGEKDVAQCADNKCITNMGVDDDTACGIGLEADDCGPYKSIFCDGNSVQPPPTCPTSCTSDSDCDANAYCNSGTSTCVLDQPDGGVCNNNDGQGNAECQADHCQNGFCCASGDCCAANTDCGAYDVASSCFDTANCEGARTDGVCSASKQCSATVVDDDSGCQGLESNSCSTYPSVFCTNAVTQGTPTCTSSCNFDTDCDASAHCDGNVCVPDSGTGGFCDEPSDCGTGLFCVDNVCCTSACNGGACEACDVEGSEGTCTAVPNNQDPDNECGGFSCANYYHSWSGDNCRSRADALDGDVACNGARACQTPAQVCPGQGVGGVAETCDDNCQSPNAGTCTGTTIGTCAEVNPGTQSCGDGVCRVTVPLCENGADKTCVPNWSAQSPETCNNLDDNCDGPIDNGSFGDSYEPNNDTSSYTSLPSVGSNDVWANRYPTLYGAGDGDHFRITGNETDSSCQCCDFFCTDEDFKLWACLQVPADAGSYQFCVGDSATSATQCQAVLAGQELCWVTTRDGACCPGGCNDNTTRYYRVLGGNSPGYECTPYRLRYKYQTGCY